jgi:hypothetical protein
MAGAIEEKLNRTAGLTLAVWVMGGVALVGLGGLGCSAPQEPAGPPPLCRQAMPSTESNVIRPLRPAEWLRLLVSGREGQRVTRECTGSLIQSPTPSRTCAGVLSEEELRPRQVTEDGVVDQRLPDGRRLVWVRTHELANGDLVGPVAVVESANGGWNVRSIGIMRTRPQRVRLRMERLGARRVLIADGERCADPERLESCEQGAYFMLLRGDRFVQAELHRETGECVGWAQVEFGNSQNVDVEGNWVRQFSLVASYDVADGAVVVHQQVSAVDRDETDEGIPPRPYRSAEAASRWLPLGTHFVTSGQSLWESMLSENGSLRLPDNE